MSAFQFAAVLLLTAAIGLCVGLIACGAAYGRIDASGAAGAAVGAAVGTACIAVVLGVVLWLERRDGP